MMDIIANHCASVGKDKQGPTNCKACPASVRAECYENSRPAPQGWTAIVEHKRRVAAAIINERTVK